MVKGLALSPGDQPLYHSQAPHFCSDRALHETPMILQFKLLNAHSTLLNSSPSYSVMKTLATPWHSIPSIYIISIEDSTFM